eukprot:1409360-Pyramimonas_sp.AAC.1
MLGGDNGRPGGALASIALNGVDLEHGHRERKGLRRSRLTHSGLADRTRRRGEAPARSPRARRR